MGQRVLSQPLPPPMWVRPARSQRAGHKMEMITFAITTISVRFFREEMKLSSCILSPELVSNFWWGIDLIPQEEEDEISKGEIKL